MERKSGKSKSKALGALIDDGVCVPVVTEAVLFKLMLVVHDSEHLAAIFPGKRAWVGSVAVRRQGNKRAIFPSVIHENKCFQFFLL